jgi:tetratricopeptide (TPR) repeat protein
MNVIAASRLRSSHQFGDKDVDNANYSGQTPSVRQLRWVICWATVLQGASIAFGDYPSDVGSSIAAASSSHDDTMDAWVISESVPGWKQTPSPTVPPVMTSQAEVSDTGLPDSSVCDLLIRGNYEEAFRVAAAGLHAAAPNGEAGDSASVLRKKLLTAFAAHRAGHFQIGYTHLSDIAVTLDKDNEPELSTSFRLCVLTLLCDSCRVSIDFRQGAKAMDRALAIVEAKPDVSAERCALVLLSTARLLVYLGQYEAAKESLLLVCDDNPHVENDASLLSAEYNETLGAFHAARGKYAVARIHFERARDTKERTLGSAHASLIPPLIGIGVTSCELADSRLAGQSAQAALEILNAVSPNDNQSHASCLRILATARMIDGDIASAVQLAEQALDKSRVIENHVIERAHAHLLLGQLARAKGELEEALRHGNCCIKVLRDHELGHHSILVKANYNVASAHLVRHDLGPAMNNYSSSKLYVHP